MVDEITYYPGCGLKEGAEGSEIGFKSLLDFFGVEVREMDDWVCCGVEYSLPIDDLANKIAPIRNLLRAWNQGVEELYVPCSMCYATLKRAEDYVRAEKEDMETINDLMNKEDDYWGGVEVKHSSELFSELIEESDLEVEDKDLNLASYPGCTLLRPDDFSIQDGLFDSLLERVGFVPVDYQEKDTCCGAFFSVHERDITRDRSDSVISSAREAGADAIVLSCPLCEYNLSEVSTLDIPIIYFSQAIGLGLGLEDLGLEYNRTIMKNLLNKLERGNTMMEEKQDVQRG